MSSQETDVYVHTQKRTQDTTVHYVHVFFSLFCDLFSHKKIYSGIINNFLALTSFLKVLYKYENHYGFSLLTF